MVTEMNGCGMASQAGLSNQPDTVNNLWTNGGLRAARCSADLLNRCDQPSSGASRRAALGPDMARCHPDPVAQSEALGAP
ncbi:unnamed protein product [Lota lota]